MAPPGPDRRLRLRGGFRRGDAPSAPMVCTSEPICNRCVGGHALSNAYRDCYAGSIAHIDGNPFPDEHSSGHGCPHGDSDADTDGKSVSHPVSHSDTTNSHASSCRPHAVANPHRDVSSTVIG